MWRAPEPPLNDRELRILRGMLDEYEFDRKRRARFLGQLSGLERGVLVVLAAGPWVDLLIRVRS